MYIDPSLGSLVFQAVAALLVSCGVFWATCKTRITGLFFHRGRAENLLHGESGAAKGATIPEIDDGGFLK